MQCKATVHESKLAGAAPDVSPQMVQAQQHMSGDATAQPYAARSAAGAQGTAVSEEVSRLGTDSLPLSRAIGLDAWACARAHSLPFAHQLRGAVAAMT